jgi:hypothetical protein
LLLFNCGTICGFGGKDTELGALLLFAALLLGALLISGGGGGGGGSLLERKVLAISKVSTHVKKGQSHGK